MDKKKAVVTLLGYTDVVNEATKKQILEQIDTLSEEQLEAIGKYLALAVKEEIAVNSELTSGLENLVKTAEKEEEKQQQQGETDNVAALTIVILASSVLADEEKAALLAYMPGYDEETIERLRFFLASEKGELTKEQIRNEVKKLLAKRQSRNE